MTCAFNRETPGHMARVKFPGPNMLVKNAGVQFLSSFRVGPSGLVELMKKLRRISTHPFSLLPVL
jgi:hypothetical protein